MTTMKRCDPQTAPLSLQPPEFALFLPLCSLVLCESFQQMIYELNTHNCCQIQDIHSNERLNSV